MRYKLGCRSFAAIKLDVLYIHMTSLSRSSEQKLYQALITARMFQNKLAKREKNIGDCYLDRMGNSYLDDLVIDLQKLYFDALKQRTNTETRKNNASVRNLISSAWKQLQSH